MRKKDLYRAIAKLAIENEQLDDYENSLMAGNDKLIAEIDSLRTTIFELKAENERLKYANWDSQAESDNRPTMAGFYAKEEMDRSATAILSQDAVYPDPSLRSVDSEDDLPEM